MDYHMAGEGGIWGVGFMGCGLIANFGFFLLAGYLGTRMLVEVCVCRCGPV